MTLTAMRALRLNLGCGAKPLPASDGWINVDGPHCDSADLVHDLRRPLPYAANVVEEIYAKHIIEHFSRSEWPGILADWVRVLAPGGRLVIECPDMMAAMSAFMSDKFSLRWEFWHTVIFGEDGPGMRHQQGFTIPRLRGELEEAGLHVMRCRAWHDDFPAHVDDPAWWYNLRMEAVKP